MWSVTASLTPLPPRYIEGYLVTMADKVSATRETLSLDRFNKPKALERGGMASRSTAPSVTVRNRRG